MMQRIICQAALVQLMKLPLLLCGRTVNTSVGACGRHVHPSVGTTSVPALQPVSESSNSSHLQHLQRLPVFRRADEYGACVESVLQASAKANLQPAAGNLIDLLLTLTTEERWSSQPTMVSISILQLLAHLHIQVHPASLERKLTSLLKAIQLQITKSQMTRSPKSSRPAARQRHHETEAKQLTAIAVALSHLQHSKARQWHTLMTTSATILPDFHMFDLGRLLLATAAAAQTPQGILHILPQTISSLVANTNLTHDMAIMYQAMFSLRWYNQRVMDTLCARVPSLIGSEPNDIMAIANCLASVRHYDPKALAWLSQSIVSVFNTLTLPLVIRAMWAFATFNFRHPDFLELSYQRIKKYPAFKFSHQALLQLAWSCAVFECQDGALLQMVFDAADSHLASYEDLSEVLHNNRALVHALFQLHLWLQDTGQLGKLGIGTSSRLQAAIQLASQQGHVEVVVSGAQKKMFRCMQLLELKPVLEKKTDDGLFSIDIVITYLGKKVAVEVDGPTHFSSNLPYVLTGASVLRNRFLRHRGYYAVSIPLFESVQMSNLPQLKKYLERKLRSAIHDV